MSQYPFDCFRFSELSQQTGGILEGYQLEEALQNLSLVESEQVSDEKLRSVDKPMTRKLTLSEFR